MTALVNDLVEGDEDDLSQMEHGGRHGVEDLVQHTVDLSLHLLAVRQHPYQLLHDLCN